MSNDLDDKVTRFAKKYLREDGTLDQALAVTALVRSLNRGEQDAILNEGASARLALNVSAIENEAASRAKQLLGGKTSLIADLEATMPIDDKTGSKPIRKMFEREFYKALCRREESLRRETAQMQRMRATYEAFRPIWREHPEWTVEQCDEEYRRREMEAVAQATG